MRIKLILVGIFSIMVGAIDIYHSWIRLSECAEYLPMHLSGYFSHPVNPANSCSFPNYGVDSILGVFLIIGIILLVAGIIKKSPVHTSSKTQLGE